MKPTPISEIKGVGEAVAKKLHLLGIRTKEDLIWNFPRKYDDYSQITDIDKLKPGHVTIKAKIVQAKGRYVRRGMHITEAVASDNTGSVHLFWFNQPYRAKGLKQGWEYYISGNYELSRGRFSIMNPGAELASNFQVNTARIIPIYRETRGLKSSAIRKIMAGLMDDMKLIDEGLPDFIIKEQNLISRADALLGIHFPTSIDDISRAKRRLAFEEVFTPVLAALINKQDNMRAKSVKIPFNEELAKTFVSRLPYKLTDAQRKVIWQIYQDIQKDVPANRLVQGDVGAGKTVVAAMCAVMAMSAKPTDLDAGQGSKEERAKRTESTVSERQTLADKVMRQESAGMTGSAGQQGQTVREFGGYQVAFMAPTELLARQHAKSLEDMLRPLGMADKIVLLLGSMKPAQKKKAHEAIKSGQAELIIGTHALISEKVDMKKLGLAIIDEQHRFGVEQRKELLKKAGHVPHLISMTATPIPRSLALTVYGELDVSVIDELPPGRKPPLTKIVSPNSKKQVYASIDKELEKGRQMFVVCPLISESDKLDFLSAEEVYKDLSKKVFPNRRVALLHGKLKADEKERIMEKFVEGKTDILVSTTVIEVGVDVPNATVMLIEGVERFGLAQIHQLRGRIGRGEHQGHCYLMMSDSKAPSRRLRALEQTNDGFKLAELDLELRGPGAVYGVAQHGELDLRLADITDTRLIASARTSAQGFLDKGEKLSDYPWLAGEVEKNRLITTLN
ncbi:MAG TPA: ATP-dependent DNA helicase RecG [Candidatus Saccharimonadales bacterium]|nr:ATP-dependent DNA helicase RecG [Candidatus Saccharimonadales bacterium]